MSDGPLEFTLYIKASFLDKEDKGANPDCQRFFMLSYLLAQEEYARFSVFSVDPTSPPEKHKKKFDGKQYPILEVTSDTELNGQSLADSIYGFNDNELEKFFDAVCGKYNCTHLKSSHVDSKEALTKFKDLYSSFNKAIQQEECKKERVEMQLEKVNDHLTDLTEKPFLTGEKMSFADCMLFPKLHHILVVLWYAIEYELPERFVSLRSYIKKVYSTEAFTTSQPTDQDILNHYCNKLKKKPERLGLQAKVHTRILKKKKEETKTTVNGGENGSEEGLEQEQEEEVAVKN